MPRIPTWLRLFLFSAAAAAGLAYLLRKSATPARSSSSSGSCIGNPSSMAVHRAGCRVFTPSADSPRFPSRDEAVAAGYHPCGICKP
jgi:hypothetical protein